MAKFSLLLLATGVIASNVFAEDVRVINNCGQSLYVMNRKVNSVPFTLAPNTERTVTVNRIPTSDPSPRPRIWAHTGCNQMGQNCNDPGNYVSLAEFYYTETGQIWYDVSQVDGYNLPITMEVPGNPTGGRCSVGRCQFNIDANCPANLKRGNNNGKTAACENDDRDNEFSDYVKAMKASCPGVYTWSRDNDAGMRDCPPGNNALKVTFC